MQQLLTPQQLYKTYTAAEFALLPEGPPYYELINGKLVPMAGLTDLHQALLLFLTLRIGAYVQQHQLGIVRFAPLDVHLSATDVYQPDLFFIAQARKKIVSEKILGAPDFIVEVLSPSSAYYDWNEKREAYARAGVREYWIVDPRRQTVEQCLLQYDSLQATHTFDKKGMLKSPVIAGLEIDIEEMFGSVSPK